MKHIVRLSISPLMKCRLGENLGSRLVCCGIRGEFPILWIGLRVHTKDCCAFSNCFALKHHNCNLCTKRVSESSVMSQLCKVAVNLCVFCITPRSLFPILIKRSHGESAQSTHSYLALRVHCI